MLIFVHRLIRKAIPAAMLFHEQLILSHSLHKLFAHPIIGWHFEIAVGSEAVVILNAIGERYGFCGFVNIIDLGII